MQDAGSNVPRDDQWTVDKALATNSVELSESSASPISYFHLLERLKTTKRAGWRRFGINEGESIADHMYRMSLMVMLAPPSLRQSLDLTKCMKMCLIHDMAESLVGDITPSDGVSKTEKLRREGLAMDFVAQRLLGNVYGGASGEEIRAIWQEHEDSVTQESLFVQDLDKVELLLQMVEYEKREKVDLSQFSYVATKVRLPEIKLWVAEILGERDKSRANWAPLSIETEEGAASAQIKKMVDRYYDGE